MSNSKTEFYGVFVIAAFFGIALTTIFFALASSPQTSQNTIGNAVQQAVQTVATPAVVFGPPHPRDYTQFSSSDITCSSDYVMKRVKTQLARVNDPPLATLRGKNVVTVTIDLDTIVTLGKTTRGIVCDADVEGFNQANEKVFMEEIFYRLEPSDNDKILWVEYLTRDQAMVAR